MSYRGHIKNGVVVLDEPAALPEGAAVEVDAVSASCTADVACKKTRFQDRYGSVIGAISGMPPDLAENHDHYLHGRPKK
ncbi:MAG: hypothetical protein HUU16_21085 [Candidatus Omnitrophica bacterium]|nr:hypothetical protein [bacterium]NUN98658.1 hypothetical protein [Candidatus Omnitrophota bacterium]